MKSQKTLSLLFAAVSLLASCSNDFDLGGIFSEAVSEVNVSIADADYTETINTRSSHSVDPSRGFVTTWTEGDTIGIYPIGADQVAFPISGGEGSSTAKFDGGAWSLRASRQYGAYYPFSKKNYYIDETRIPISYLGQKQTGNNNLDNLSYYDFMAAAAVSPDANGAVNMTMQHLGAFLRLTITAPETKTYTKVRLSSDAAIFTTDATINLQNGSLTPTKKAEVLTLLLDNVTTTEPNQTITAYMMLAPISASDISAHPISVTLFDDNGVSYVDDLTFTSVVAGKSYAKSANNLINNEYQLTSPELGVVDLGLSVDWGYSNLSSTSGIGQELWASGPGDFYAYGELYPKAEYTESNYLYEYPSYLNPQHNISGTEFDAARNLLGEGYRIPTIDEWIELFENCEISLLTYKGEYGDLVVGPNGNCIFIPFVGHRQDGVYENPYWSATEYSFSSGICAYAPTFRPDGTVWTNGIWRLFDSCPIRFVRDK